MFWPIVLFLMILWFIGLVVNIGGGFIHFLLLIAAIVLVVNILSGRDSKRGVV